MILRKFKRTNLSRTKRSMIGGLVDYVLAEKDENGQQKCAWHFSENFIAATKNGQRAEMIALAEESIKSKMPCAHWMMSWNENEIPDEAQIRQAVGMFLKGMGLEGHQVIVALHTNTQNVHAHIVVNRVHPDTLKMIQPHNGFDIEAAHKIVAAIEKVQGWTPQKNARYRVDENNQIVRNAPRKRQPSSSKAQDFENYTGAKSAQRIAQKRAHEIIENAKSWAELHNGLKEAGLRFEKKGSGAIVFVGDVAVKASSIDREFSMGKLCKRLGEFQPGIYPQEMSQIEPEPVSKIAEDKWHEYMDARKAAKMEHKRRREDLLAKNALAIAEVKIRQKAHKQSAYANLAQYGPELVGIARLLLPKQHSQELAKARKELHKMPKLACGRFKDWLRQRNSWLADIWRLRRLLKPGMKYGHFEEGRFPKIGKLQNPLIAYREMVKRRYADMKLAQSRIDAGTALHLRCAGYLRKEVEEEMQRHTPPPANPADLAPKLDYIQRILDYAFGAQGDIWVIGQRLGKPEVEKFNKEAEIIDYYMKHPPDESCRTDKTRFRQRLR